MTAHIRSILVFSSICLSAGLAHAEPIEGVLLPLPAPDGWVLAPDGVTLIVSQAEKGSLVYFDTVGDREAKRVELDFKPGAMAVQGDNLFVAGKGSSVVYVLDVKTGKQKKEIALEGAAGVANLACHPTSGPVFASTKTLKVFVLNPSSGTAIKTSATGNFLAVDPNNGSTLFTAVQPPRDETEIIIKDLPDGRIKIIFDRWGARAFMLKYTMKEKDLKLVSSQRNAAVNGYALAITPDGKKVMMSSGGGWRAPVEGGTAEGLACAAFSTDNLNTMVGEAPGGTNLAFHPVLNLGVVNKEGREIQLFNPKSLVKGTTYQIAKGADARPLLVTFAAKGTKVVLWNGDNPKNPLEGLHFLPLELKDADRVALEKVYGKLPAVPKAITPGASTLPELAVGNVIASTGFNSIKGLNTGAKVQPPYMLGKADVQGGAGERGWKGLWPASPNAIFVKDVVQEGDGALKLIGTQNYGREWSKPQTEKFVVETALRVPAGGGGTCYIWGDGATTTGPMMRILDGKLKALNGDARGRSDWLDIVDVKPNTWYKLVVSIDVPNKAWNLSVDGKAIAKRFGFRTNVNALRAINFLAEGSETIYVDSIRVLAEPEKK